MLLPNVQDEPRPWLARAVLLGARIVTAMVVGSGALLGRFGFTAPSRVEGEIALLHLCSPAFDHRVSHPCASRTAPRADHRQSSSELLRSLARFPRRAGTTHDPRLFP